MKEIRGGLPEKDANRGFWGVSIFFLIVLVLFGFLLCREGTGICETIIGIGAIYLILLCFFDIFNFTVLFYRNFQVICNE